MSAPKTITVKGKSYKVRYVTDVDGKPFAVVDGDDLTGEFGDMWPLVSKGGKLVAKAA